MIGLVRELAADLPDDVGILFDGFPRTRAQAVALDETLGALDRDVDVVLDIRVPEDVLVERLSGRWICRTCQTPYNVNSRPPATPGVCDVDGGELYQRDDDTAEAVRTRLATYVELTEPVARLLRRPGHARDGGRQPVARRGACGARRCDAAVTT